MAERTDVAEPRRPSNTKYYYWRWNGAGFASLCLDGRRVCGGEVQPPSHVARAPEGALAQNCGGRRRSLELLVVCVRRARPIRRYELLQGVKAIRTAVVVASFSAGSVRCIQHRGGWRITKAAAAAVPRYSSSPTTPLERRRYNSLQSSTTYGCYLAQRCILAALSIRRRG